MQRIRGERCLPVNDGAEQKMLSHKCDLQVNNPSDERQSGVADAPRAYCRFSEKFLVLFTHVHIQFYAGQEACQNTQFQSHPYTYIHTYTRNTSNKLNLLKREQRFGIWQTIVNILLCGRKLVAFLQLINLHQTLLDTSSLPLVHISLKEEHAIGQNSFHMEWTICMVLG